MSEDRFSIGEFSEFLNDSEGHRLAQFLQKKTGAVGPTRPLFDCGNGRFSLNVKLKRISLAKDSQEQQLATAKPVSPTIGTELIEPKESSQGKGENEKRNEQENDRTLATEEPPVARDSNVSHSKQASEQSMMIENVKNGTLVPEVPCSVTIPAPEVKENSEVASSSAANVAKITRRVLSPARRSGGGGTADRLRRNTLKRLTHLNIGGRRTLLKEFESTLSTPDFEPMICSTPLSHRELDKNSMPEQSAAIVAEEQLNLAGGATYVDTSGNVEKSPLSSFSALRRKDEELRKMLESVMETAIEKLHEKENKSQNTSLVNLHVTTPQCSGEEPCTPRSQRSSLHCVDALAPTQAGGVNVTKQQTQNVEIVGTQELLEQAQNMLKSLNESRTHVSKIVIPVQQTFNGMPAKDNPKLMERQCVVENASKENKAENASTHSKAKLIENKSIVNDLAGKSKIDLNEQNCSMKSCTNRTNSLLAASALVQHNVLHLTEIMTDDDSDVSLPSASRSGRSAPLDLVATRTANSSQHGQNRRFRKRLNTRRHRGSSNRSPLTSTETETESGPPPAHPLNLRSTQHSGRKVRTYKRPLNKAPNIPINGEQFAEELKAQLARLTNYEILDLRKRNSVGDIFPIPGRRSKSRLSGIVKQQVLEQRLQLEEQIEMELLRRNLQGDAEGLPDAAEAELKQQQYLDNEVRDEDIFLELPPVPDPFQDSPMKAGGKTDASAPLPTEELPLQITTPTKKNSSLIGERSCDRVSFARSTSNLPESFKRRGRSKKDTPEIVKNYLAVQNDVPKHRPLNQSKRSLYSKGHSDSESEADVNNLPIPVPPVISPTRPITDLRIPSPPPPMDVTSQRHSTSSSRKSVKAAEEIVPPPGPFLDVVGSLTASNGSDDAVFKKPLQPAPKLRGRSKNKTQKNIVSTFGTEENTSEEQPLRRSKRGHVPLKNSSISLQQVLFQEVITKNFEKRKRTNKNKNSECASSLRIGVETLTPVASSTANMHSNVESQPRRCGKRAQKTKNLKSGMSLLGDTDATCQTTASESGSVVGLPLLTKSKKVLRMTAIHEPPSESDAEYHSDIPVAPVAINTTNKTAMVEKITSKQPEKRAAVVKRKTSNAIPKTSPMKKLCGLEHSRIQVPPAPVEQLNNIFDQLKHSSVKSNKPATARVQLPSETSSSCISATNQSRIKKLRVRLKRVNSSRSPSYSTDNANTATTGNEQSPKATVSTADTVSRMTSISNVDLVSWLKGVCEVQTSNSNEKIFMDMHFSAADNLMFTDLEGLDYAFYDTDDKASLGYLRFKPRQKKPAKKAKKYHLHFVVLTGTFDIGTDREHGTFSIGDMVAINKGCRYTIQNLRDDVGLLMVIKK